MLGTKSTENKVRNWREPPYAFIGLAIDRRGHRQFIGADYDLSSLESRCREQLQRDGRSLIIERTQLNRSAEASARWAEYVWVIYLAFEDPNHDFHHDYFVVSRGGRKVLFSSFIHQACDTFKALHCQGCFVVRRLKPRLQYDAMRGTSWIDVPVGPVEVCN